MTDDSAHPRFTTALQIGIGTFGILALELSIIRWMSGQIRLFAYFSNLLLMAAFLGMGLGLALGVRRPRLVHATLPMIAALSAILAYSDDLGLMHLRFPDPSVVLWGAESTVTFLGFLGSTATMLGLFWLVTAVFVMAGVPIGWRFGQIAPLRAYSADLLGSLAGVAVLTLLAALDTPPPVWIAVAVLPFLILSPRPLSFLSAIAAVGFAAVSVRGAYFSPYNRIDVRPLPQPLETGEPGAADLVLSVNRDFHQYVLDLSDEAVAKTPAGSRRRAARATYDLPFAAHGGKGRVLVVGAGTGNDVIAALRRGYDQVVSVDIDPVILKLGARLHPERPYSDPRAVRVVNDARAYFEQNPGEMFDVVCYGLLDSHAVFSAMSSLRLDNYVYTVEGIRAGWAHVKEGGVLALSFATADSWLMMRLQELVRQGTGNAPSVLGRRGATTYLVKKGSDPLVAATAFKPIALGTDPSIRIPTDDWPFLYLRPGAFPFAYVGVLTLVLGSAAVAARGAYGKDLLGPGGFDPALFLMGAGFMLLETRMVTELSLLFGSTWIVNSSVFFGILLMAFVANTLVSSHPIRNVGAWYLPLAASILLTWYTGAGKLNSLPVLARGIVGSALYALPVAFAGVIFSSLLRRSRNPAGSLGANLLGALAGGALEYLSMVVGLRSLALIALVLYLGSYLAASRRGSLAAAA